MKVAHFNQSTVIPPFKPQVNLRYPSATDQYGNTYFKRELVVARCPDGTRAVGYTAEQAIATAERQMPLVDRIYLQSVYRRQGVI